MSHLEVHGQPRPLRGSVPLPSEPQLGDLALVLAALSRGRCELRGFTAPPSNLPMLRALRELGVPITELDGGALRIEGRGLHGLRAPRRALDCGGASSSLHLLAGVLSAQPFESQLTGEDALEAEPLLDLVTPLRERGAVVDAEPHPTLTGELRAPLWVGPAPEGGRVGGLEWLLPLGRPLVKASLLLGGLFAAAPTVLQEPVLSRDHTERLLSALEMPIEAVGPLISLHPPLEPTALRAFTLELPGDMSAAAALLVAAALVSGSHVTTRKTSLNPSRSGLLDVLRQAGVQVGLSPHGDVLGESFGEVSVMPGHLRAFSVSGELAVRSLDELPLLAALAARAHGVSELSGLLELPRGVRQQLSAMVGVLRAFGVACEERPGSLTIEGRPDAPLQAVRLPPLGDASVTMAAAVLALAAQGASVIEGAAAVQARFPRFAGSLRALGAQARVQA